MTEDRKSAISIKSKAKIIPQKVVTSKPQVTKQMEKIERDVRAFELKLINKSVLAADVTQKSSSFLDTRDKCSQALVA